MREILFKGKKEVNGDWIEGFLSWVDTRRQRNHFVNNHVVISETVCQFTGLTDKNGVKIFSDDLLKDKQGTIFRIYQINGGFCLKATVWQSDTKDWVDSDLLITVSLTEAQTQSYIAESCEAVGNIHEKEL